MPVTIGETFYDLALRALEEQEREVSSLRSRAGTLAATSAVIASLLVRGVFADTSPDGGLAWLAAATGLAGLTTVLVATVLLLRSYDLRFSIDAGAAMRLAGELTEDEARPDVVLRQAARAAARTRTTRRGFAGCGTCSRSP